MPEKTLFNEWTDVVAEGRNALVFKERNKNYGAFELRRRYNRTVTIALTIAVVSFLFDISFLFYFLQYQPLNKSLFIN